MGKNMGRGWFPKNHGKTWSNYDRDMVRKYLGQGIGIGEISRRLKRTNFAIECEIARSKINDVGLIINGKNYSSILTQAK